MESLGFKTIAFTHHGENDSFSSYYGQYEQVIIPLKLDKSFDIKLSGRSVLGVTKVKIFAIGFCTYNIKHYLPFNLFLDRFLISITKTNISFTHYNI